jgi:hypothetical protein
MIVAIKRGEREERRGYRRYILNGMHSWSALGCALHSRRKRRIRKIMPYRFASTGLITGYLQFSRDFRKNVECSFILLADMTMIFFSN